MMDLKETPTPGPEAIRMKAKFPISDAIKTTKGNDHQLSAVTKLCEQISKGIPILGCDAKCESTGNANLIMVYNPCLAELITFHFKQFTLILKNV